MESVDSPRVAISMSIHERWAQLPIFSCHTLKVCALPDIFCTWVCGPAAFQEEAFMAVGALADQMEKPFINYMEAFLPILIQGLSNNAEYQVSTTVKRCCNRSRPNVSHYFCCEHQSSRSSLCRRFEHAWLRQILPVAFSLFLPEYLMIVVDAVFEIACCQVCIVATGVVGDLCRALEQDILPYCQHIMGWLMVNLEGANINRWVSRSRIFFFFFFVRRRGHVVPPAPPPCSLASGMRWNRR